MLLNQKSIILFYFLIITFSLLTIRSAQASPHLSLDENQILINEDNGYKQINLKLLEDGNPISWKTKEALKISENIAISDSVKNQYGYKNNKDILFIPIGIAENDYEYQILIVPTRHFFLPTVKEFFIVSPLLLGQSPRFSVTVKNKQSQVTSIKDLATIKLSKSDKDEIIESVKKVSNYEMLYSVLLGAIIPLVFFAIRKNDLKDVLSQRMLSTDNRLSDEFKNIHSIQLDVVSKNLTIEQTVKEIHELSEESKMDLKNLSKISLKINPDIRKEFQKIHGTITNKINQSEQLSKNLENSLKGFSSELVKLDLAIKKVENESINDIFDLQIELLDETKRIKVDLLKDIHAHSNDINQINNLMKTRLDALQHYINEKISTLRPIDYNYLDKRAESIFDEKYDRIGNR
ncbi:MAG: hypothetical protein ACH34X_15775 [Thiolinea sp.]